MEFNELGLNERILEAVKRAGYEMPSPIQQQAVPPALKGRDILGCAQTGTGKTAAFAMPILDRLSRGYLPDKHKKRTIRALILTPTRELAAQIHDSFKTYGHYLKLKSGIVIGGVSQYLQRDIIENGVDILIATPGRLLDYLSQEMLDISRIEVFVLDEADRMLDMGFINDVKRVLTYLPAKRQTMFFTATMPDDVRKLAVTILTDPVSISVDPQSPATELVAQTVLFTDKKSKPELIVWLLNNDPEIRNALVFTRTKHGADRLAKVLKREGIDALAIHGDKSQGARQNALDSFKAGKVRILVATDMAARGIDIDELSHVINYEIPNIAETYVHRIGRTGRAGRSGKAISFCDFDEKEYLKDIEKLIKKRIPEFSDHPYPMQVFEKSPPKVPQPRPTHEPRNTHRTQKKY